MTTDFDFSVGTWTVANRRLRNPRIDEPVFGRFADCVGAFHCDETYTGAGHVDTPIRVRFLWKDITLTSAGWEQAFSPDAGTTTETNWVMDSTRTS